MPTGIQIFKFGDKLDSLMKCVSISVTKIILLNPTASLSFIIELVYVKCNLKIFFEVTVPSSGVALNFRQTHPRLHLFPSLLYKLQGGKLLSFFTVLALL